ncbi:hypothetical protein RRG08_022014 [Elysia crispata]|uniref:Uncharacterized protein n=1 Tax=Elysia crispata TaxID=231223 RepID=A0AAE1DUX2_9GAST|nr:hypothetical protein RRG08_022014 [Elysia crispata]
MLLDLGFPDSCLLSRQRFIHNTETAVSSSTAQGRFVLYNSNQRGLDTETAVSSSTAQGRFVLYNSNQRGLD